MPDAFVRVENLSKVFQMGRQQVNALARVSLDIPAGSFSVIMGPSGSGKSTLLYLLGGLDRPTSGSVIIDDRPLESMDENLLAVYRRRKMGFVFQSFNLIPSMTALENVMFPMSFAAVPHAQRIKRATQVLKQVGLENRMHHRPTELSGGQQQRVAIARALVMDPPLILADEPTGNLDTASGFGVMQLLGELNHSGRTIIVVTHDPRIERFATQIVYLLDGLCVGKDEYEHAISMLSFTQEEALSS
jgi:putative ABC transport system ATP-binding protein